MTTLGEYHYLVNIDDNYFKKNGVSVMLNRLAIIIVALVTTLSACDARENDTTILKSKPTTVLVGTDIKEIKEFKITGNIVTGKYMAETGGAELSLMISEYKGSFKISRIYKEPGMSPETKQYTLNKNNKAILSSKSVIIISVENGILVLESNPESYGISNEIWNYYQRR